MNDPIEVRDCGNGGTVELHYDESPVNPRAEFDNFSTFCFSGRGYEHLSDNDGTESLGDWFVAMLAEVEETYEDEATRFRPITDRFAEWIEADKRKCGYAYVTWCDFERQVSSEVCEAVHEALYRLERHGLVVPLYLYEHGGLSLSTRPFSFIGRASGYAWVSFERLRKEFSVSRVTEKTRELALQSIYLEVAEFDQYLRGEVFGIVHKDSNGTVADSCWGYFGEKWALDTLERWAERPKEQRRDQTQATQAATC